VKIRVPPSSTEIFVDGARLTFPAKSGGPGLPPPPHAEIPKKERITTAENRPRERNLPMHSSSNLAVILQ
jgi:hypothetical protein